MVLPWTLDEWQDDPTGVGPAQLRSPIPRRNPTSENFTVVQRAFVGSASAILESAQGECETATGTLVLPLTFRCPIY